MRSSHKRKHHHHSDKTERKKHREHKSKEEKLSHRHKKKKHRHHREEPKEVVDKDTPPHTPPAVEDYKSLTDSKNKEAKTLSQDNKPQQPHKDHNDSQSRQSKEDFESSQESLQDIKTSLKDAESRKSVEKLKHFEEAKPSLDIKLSKHSEGTKPSQNTKSSEGMKPSQGTKSSEATKPLQSTKHSEGTKPSQNTKSSEGTKPVQDVESNAKPSHVTKKSSQDVEALDVFKAPAARSVVSVVKASKVLKIAPDLESPILPPSCLQHFAETPDASCTKEMDFTTATTISKAVQNKLTEQAANNDDDGIEEGEILELTATHSPIALHNPPKSHVRKLKRKSSQSLEEDEHTSGHIKLKKRKWKKDKDRDSSEKLKKHKIKTK